MKYFTSLFLFCCVAAFGQTISRAHPETFASSPATNSASSVNAPAAATNAPSESAVGGYVLDDKYKLSAGDKVSFQILEDRDPAKSLLITDSGELDVPYIGRVIAANKTCKQLADELKTQLEKDYY